MSTERIIHLADLAVIESSLRNLSSDIGTVSSQVENVGQELVNTRSELASLIRDFRDFVARDAREKQIGFAETRLVKIRQELDTKYGYYGEVRRHATGILQAVDVSVVRQETVSTATEELMLSAPRYWLAPALVALAAWLRDDKALAEKALAEAIRRDDEKTSLFFALIARRASRGNACRTWLERYFGMQDPTRLDRQSVVLVDALASGVFGVEVKAQCARRIEGWVEELGQRAGFLEEQRKQWNAGLRSKMPTASHVSRYSYLSQYSPTWPALNASLNGAAMQAVVRDHFKAIFDGPIPPSPNLMAAVDRLLDKLVENFDDEELPLRREEKRCQLIIEEGGDTTAAGSRYDLESKSLDELVSFTQLLTNAAMHPEASHASRATQRFAIALSRAWVKDAHQDLTADLRASVPTQADLAIEDWQGRTRNGENETELAASLGGHIDRRLERALAEVKLKFQHWAGLGLGVVLLVSAFGGGILPFALGAGCLVWVYLAHANVGKTKARLRADFARLKEQSLQALKATLAEMVEWRRDFARRDAVAAEVVQILDAVSPEQYVLSSHDNVRQVMAKPAA